MNSSYTLFCALKNMGYLKNAITNDRYWWPNSGTFEAFIGAILTQNTKWENVDKALLNLKSNKLLSLNKIYNIDIELLQSLIKPSGFYRQKSIRIKNICKNIKDTFLDFENFKNSVSRNWLLSQKGIGDETADSILCYCCYKDEMVVDKYTYRLLFALGLELDNYDDIKEWLSYGIEENLSNLGYKNLYEAYAIFHGMIVLFCKDNCKKNKVNIQNIIEFIN